MTDTTWWPELAEPGAAKHQALKVSIRGAIASGRIGPRDRLPPVREVAWRLQITPGTVARAYKDLVEAGVLEAVVGRGTFVAGEAPVDPLPLPYPTEPIPEGGVNLRSAHVLDVGQAEIFHRIQSSLPPPRPGDYVNYPYLAHDLPLRQALARWMATDSHGAIDAGDMVLALGAQHAMMVVFQTILHGPRPVVLTEELAYPGFRHAAALARAGIVGVPFDAEGPLPEALDRIATETGAQIFCTSADAHNPTTIRTSPDRRAAIASIARAHAMQIIDDDCYGLTQETAPGYRRIAPERTWLVSSLSKTLSPDLRMGMIVAPEGRVQALRAVAQQQFFGLPRPVVDLVTALLQGGEAERIRARGAEVTAARVAHARAVLDPWGARLRDGVPFAWLPMPRGWRASSFLRAAEAEGIRLKAADEFALIDGRAPNAVRIALTAVRSETRYREALATLDRLLRTPPIEIDI